MMEGESSSSNSASSSFDSSMNVEELADWLHQKGIPREFCEAFEENYIDGNEFLELSRPDVQRMVKPLGLVNKIMRLIPNQNVAPSTPTTTPVESSGSSLIATQVQSAAAFEDASTGSPSISSTSSVSGIEIPSHWRPETQYCIDKKCLNPDARNDIVRTLVTLSIAKFGQRPSRADCQQQARKLIMQYPFMKDDIGVGYTSWVEKMLERIRNLIKADHKKNKDLNTNDSPNALKRSKKMSAKDQLLRRYPIKFDSNDLIEDPASVSQHITAIGEEMKKAKPRESLILPLMKKTFRDRWEFVQHDALSAKDVMEKFPAFKYPAAIEQDVALIIGQNDIKPAFLSEWNKYVTAILTYGEKSAKKESQEIIRNLDNADDVSQSKSAMKLLALHLSLKSVKNTLCYIYSEYEQSMTVEEACVELPKRTAPRIAVFGSQYFIIVEQFVVCEVSSFPRALFIMFSCYYVFNLEYPKNVKNVMLFFQDYIFGRPDSDTRPANYLAIASDIKRNL